MRPLAIDLFSGLGGWAEGLLATGWRVVGFDIEDMHKSVGEPKPEGDYQLVIQNVLTLHGSQFRHAHLIVASPPCQFFSYTAMPWSRAKALAAEVRADPEKLAQRLALFNACFRIQREACEAAGRYIPMVVENVRGAIPWVGQSKYHYGSYHLFGDVPSLMPIAHGATKNSGGSWFSIEDTKSGVGARNDPRYTSGLDFTRLAARSENDGRKNNGGSWFNIGGPGQTVTGMNPDGRKVPGFRFDGSGRSFQSASVEAHEGRKHHGDWFSDPSAPSRQGGQTRHKPPARVSKNRPAEGCKGAGAGAAWFDQNISSLPSASPRRKAASAKIVKIPFTLAAWIGQVYFPRNWVA